MDATLLAALVGLALADALNPFTVAAQAYLLGTPRPMPRALTFLAGTYATYFLGGVLLLEGWNQFLARVAPYIPAWGLGAGEIALGLLIGGFSVWSFARASQGKPFRPPAELSLPATLAFAVASTFSDLPTALPYFAAANRIAAADAGWLHDLSWLALYNVIYCAPMIALVLAKALMSDGASAALFGRITGAIDWAFAKLLPPVMVLAALFLLGDGARRLLALS
jgi:hypothetical protein